MRNTLTIAAIAALIALLPAAAHAGTECQSGLSAGSGIDASSAWEAWEDNVANAYGAAWAKLDLAQNRNVLPITIPSLSGPLTTYTAYANPCRKTLMTVGMATNVGELQVMQIDESEPAAPVAVLKKHKLAKLFN